MDNIATPVAGRYRDSRKTATTADVRRIPDKHPPKARRASVVRHTLDR
jgi:hypothetical protein